MPDDPDAEREDLDKLKEFQADLESAGKGKGPLWHFPTGYAREMAERLGRVLQEAESSNIAGLHKSIDPPLVSFIPPTFHWFKIVATSGEQD